MGHLGGETSRVNCPDCDTNMHLDCSGNWCCPKCDGEICPHCMTVFEPSDFEFKLLCVKFLATHAVKMGDLDGFEKIFGTRDTEKVLHEFELKFRRLNGYLLMEDCEILDDERIQTIYEEQYVKDDLSPSVCGLHDLKNDGLCT